MPGATLQSVIEAMRRHIVQGQPEAAFAIGIQAIEQGIEAPELFLLTGFAAKMCADHAQDGQTRNKWREQAQVQFGSTLRPDVQASADERSTAYAGLAGIYLAQHKPKRGIALYQKAVQLAPTPEAKAHFLLALARVYILAGHFAQAHDYLHQAGQLPAWPRLPLWTLQVHLAHAQGNEEQAGIIFKTIARYLADHPEAHGEWQYLRTQLEKDWA